MGIGIDARLRMPVGDVSVTDAAYRARRARREGLLGQRGWRAWSQLPEDRVPFPAAIIRHLDAIDDDHFPR